MDVLKYDPIGVGTRIGIYFRLLFLFFFQLLLEVVIGFKSDISGKDKLHGLELIVSLNEELVITIFLPSKTIEPVREDGQCMRPTVIIYFWVKGNYFRLNQLKGTLATLTKAEIKS